MKKILTFSLILVLFSAAAFAEGGLKTKQNYVIGFYNLENLWADSKITQIPDVG